MDYGIEDRKMSISNIMWVEKYRPHKIAELVNQKENININAKLYWNLDNNNAILYIIDIPDLKNDETFQFWTDSDDKGMESMGTFDTRNEDMFKFGCMPELKKTKAVYISIEPKGGMPNLTGKTILESRI